MSRMKEAGQFVKESVQGMRKNKARTFIIGSLAFSTAVELVGRGGEDVVSFVHAIEEHDRRVEQKRNAEIDARCGGPTRPNCEKVRIVVSAPGADMPAVGYEWVIKTPNSSPVFTTPTSDKK